MRFGEAIRHVETLSKDPESWVHAALAGWEHPAPLAFFVLADLYDAFAKVHLKRPEPYPRPIPDKGKRTDRFGERIAPHEVAEVLRGFGREVPTELLNWSAQTDRTTTATGGGRDGD